MARMLFNFAQRLIQNFEINTEDAKMRKFYFDIENLSPNLR